MTYFCDNYKILALQVCNKCSKIRHAVEFACQEENKYYAYEEAMRFLNPLKKINCNWIIINLKNAYFNILSHFTDLQHLQPTVKELWWAC